MTRYRTLLGCAAIAVTVALTAVGTGKVQATATQEDPASVTATPFVAPTSAVPTLGCSDSPTSASTPLPDTTRFIDPQGSYEIDVDRDWEALHGTMVAEVEAWLVDEPDDGFAPNVNVLNQAIPAMDLVEYLDLSVTQAPAFISNFELVRLDVVEGTANELGVMEYTGTQNDLPMHFLATVVVSDPTAVVATFTAPAETFEQLRCEVEPFLFTLRSTL
jgi:hypothetical protein